jgi:hypothetical protein
MSERDECIYGDGTHTWSWDDTWNEWYCCDCGDERSHDEMRGRLMGRESS